MGWWADHKKKKAAEKAKKATTSRPKTQTYGPMGPSPAQKQTTTQTPAPAPAPAPKPVETKTTATPTTTTSSTNTTKTSTTPSPAPSNARSADVDLGLSLTLPGIQPAPSIGDPDWTFNPTDIDNNGINDSLEGGTDKVFNDMENKYTPNDSTQTPDYGKLPSIQNGEIVDDVVPDNAKPDYTDAVPKAPDDTPGKAEYEANKNQEALEDGEPLPYPNAGTNNTDNTTSTPSTEIKPTSGPTITRNEADGSTVKTYDNGTVVKEYDDGKVVTATKGGTVTVKNPDGTESSYVTSRPFENESDWMPWEKVDSGEFAKKFMWAEQARYNIKDSEVYYDKNLDKYVVRDDKGNTYLVTGEGNDSKWEQTTSWTEDANGNDTFLTDWKDKLRRPGDFLIDMEKLDRKTEDLPFDEKMEVIKQYWNDKFSDPNSRLNLALGGADENGLTRSGAVADRDGDGEISKSERVANVIDNLISAGNDRTVGMLSKGLDAVLQIAGIDDDKRRDIVDGAQTTLEVIDAVGSIFWNPLTAPIHIMAMASDVSKDPKVIAANKKHENLEESLYGTGTPSTSTPTSTETSTADPIKETAQQTYERLKKEKADADRMAVETIRRHEAEEMKNTSVGEKQDKLKEIELANIQKKRRVEAMNKANEDKEKQLKEAMNKLNEPTTTSGGVKKPGLKYWVEDKIGFSLPF